VWLNIWFTYFPRSSFLVFKSEEYFSEPQATLHRIFAHLDLREPTDTEWINILSQSDIQPAASGKSMLLEAQRLLTTFYQPFDKDLSELMQDPKWSFF
jgi:hypothetical protein